MKPLYKRLFLLVYYLVYAFVYAGWLFHRSFPPVIFQYSVKYFIFLVITALFFLPPIITHICVKRIGWKRFLFSIIPSLILIVLLYFAFSLRYYYTQEHLFDPFLQNDIERSKNRPIDKNDNTFRIICLGGSTTENLALPQEKRYPETLHKILQDYYPSVEIEVLNAGTNWYTTKHSLISYVTYYEDWNPDLIIVMHAINDLARSFSPPDFAIGEYNDLWTHFYGPSISGAKPPTFEQHILQYFETPLNAWYSKLRFFERDYPVKRYVSLPAFKKNLTKLIRYIKNNKSDIILVTQPSLYKENMEEEELRLLYFGRTITNTRLNFLQREYPSPLSFYRAMKLFNETAKEVALKEGIAVVDADNIVSKDLVNFRDDVHYTERGAKILARAITEKIINEKLVLP